MLIKKIIALVTGYICFTARSGFPERFINLCRLNKIPLQSLRICGGILTAETTLAGYKKIRPVARKSGMKVRIKKKYGMPFFLRRHSHRFGLIAGAVLCFFAVIFLSTRIWRIDVIGNERVSSEEIASVFASLGVHEGVSASGINASETEAAALRKLPEVSWININLSGCTAIIEVRETVEKPEINGENAPSNLVASRDGRVIILRPFYGKAEISLGAPVIKGDLLISGIKENKDLTSRLCRAEGYVVAETVRNAEFTLAKNFKAMKKTDEESQYTLHFLLFNIPTGKNNGGFCESTYVKVKKTVLPVGMSKTVKNTYSEVACSLNDNDAMLLANLRFSEAMAEEFRGREIKNSRVSIDKKGKSVKITAEYDCVENIGAEAPILIESK